jgi:hypothetical protein
MRTAAIKCSTIPCSPWEIWLQQRPRGHHTISNPDGPFQGAVTRFQILRALFVPAVLSSCLVILLLSP